MKCIPGDYLMKLVERMPRGCKAAFKAKGGYFEIFQVKLVERKPRVFKAVIKTKVGYFEESKI